MYIEKYVFSFPTNTIAGECDPVLRVANQTEYQVAFITGCVGIMLLKYQLL